MSGKKHINIIIILTLTAGIFLLAGYLAGRSAAGNRGDQPEKESGAEPAYSEKRAGGYDYINPLLECELSQPGESNPLISLKEEVGEYLGESIQAGKISDGAVYFRDLNNGPWFGIDEKKIFAPASLLKVPMMVAYYKLAEEDPGLLKRKLFYGGEYDDKSNVANEQTIKAGQEYEINELIRKMVVHSDNRSMKVLQHYLVTNIEQESLIRTAAGLGLIVPTDPDLENAVTVKDYAAIFRILYNASYLSKEMSEQALAMLAEGDFDRGLAAALPAGTRLANKYGYRYDPATDEMAQLHDCGIIYCAQSPYLLCVMTRGLDKDELEETIKNISSRVYADRCPK